jgi:hypothetical protein
MSHQRNPSASDKCRARDAGFYQVTGQSSETAAGDRSASRQDSFLQHGCGSSRRRPAPSAARRTETASGRGYTAWLSEKRRSERLCFRQIAAHFPHSFVLAADPRGARARPLRYAGRSSRRVITCSSLRRSWIASSRFRKRASREANELRCPRTRLRAQDSRPRALPRPGRLRGRGTRAPRALAPGATFPVTVG